MDELIEFTDHRNEDWYKYTCSYRDKNGRQYCMELWAQSDTDAQERAAAVRESFRIDGRLAMVIDAQSGDVLADSTVPENTSGVTH